MIVLNEGYQKRRDRDAKPYGKRQTAFVVVCPVPNAPITETPPTASAYRLPNGWAKYTPRALKRPLSSTGVAPARDTALLSRNALQIYGFPPLPLRAHIVRPAIGDVAEWSKALPC